MTLGWSGSLHPRKIFENLHTTMAISVLFEQFLRQVLLNFLLPTLSPLPNMKHFVRTFSIYVCLMRIVVEEIENYGKIVFIKEIVKNGW